jgi:acyl-CoA dehydrogenase
MSLSRLSPEVQEIKSKLDKFVLQRCQPAEIEYENHLKNRMGRDRWTLDAIPPCIERLKEEAKDLGLWNLFIPPHLTCGIPSEFLPSTVLSYREYGILCESMGKSFLTPEACNCNAPDTGNMEVLMHFGTPLQRERFLLPLLQGKIRSCFLMTEPDVASSDATNIETTLTRLEGPNGEISYRLNGSKWWSTGAMDPRCKVGFVLARMDYSLCPNIQLDARNLSAHRAHTVVIVDMKDVEMVRPLTVMGYDDAPQGHAHVKLNNILVTPQDLIIGEGSGFQVAQARLGPGRIHHCMRAVGMAVRCYDLMLERALSRQTFGSMLAEHGLCQAMIADSASDIEAARLLTLSCAEKMDMDGGARAARGMIAIIKVAIPNLALRVVDRALQIHGGAGFHEDLPLARILVGLRTLRVADGPDAVHQRSVALIELKKARKKLQSKL